MTRKIAAIVFIFVCTTIAWMILGGTILSRTYSTEGKLDAKVESSWGSQQTQTPPTAAYTVFDTTVEEGKQRRVARNVDLPLQSSHADAAFALDYRQKGLLWYSSYAVNFAGTYTFQNTSSRQEDVVLRFPLPSANAIYDDLSVTVDGQPAAAVTTRDSGVETSLAMDPGKTVSLAVSYRSRGLNQWDYKLGAGVAQARDFDLTMHTNFKQIDFPVDDMSPTSKQETADGWDLHWKYRNLLSGQGIGLTMPQREQPGPLAGQISLFAPVSLFFFFFLMFIITTMRGIDLHPMNYFFLATGFFAFHLLMAYMVDHVSIHTAFAVSSVVSIFLVVSYLRLVVGIRFAAVEAGLAQLIYLVLFSYAFFFKGYTGLAITIGSILTLFVVMQATGRVRWEERFGKQG